MPGTNFPDNLLSNTPGFIDQVKSGPIAIIHRIPIREIIVHHDRVVEVELSDVLPDSCPIHLVFELRGMHTDDDESIVGKTRLNFLDPRKGPFAVPAPISPEIDEYNPTFKIGEFQRFGIDPVDFSTVREFRRRPGCFRPFRSKNPGTRRHDPKHGRYGGNPQ